MKGLTLGNEDFVLGRWRLQPIGENSSHHELVEGLSKGLQQLVPTIREAQTDKSFIIHSTLPNNL